MGTTRDYHRYDGNTTGQGFQDYMTNTPRSTSCIGQCTTTMDKSGIGYTHDKCSEPWDLVIQRPPRIVTLL